MLRPALAAATLLFAAPACADPVRDRIYPAPTAPLTLDGLAEGASFADVAAADGLKLRGIELPGRTDKPVLLLLHGNGSSASDAVRWFAPLAAQGYGLVAAEYRGYSGNPGSPSEAGLAADADAFHAHARALAGPRKLIVVGHSLGGGVAFGLAARNRLDALVTIGTFTRLRAVVPRVARAFIKDRYDNLAAVPALDEPYFLVHGTADDVVWAGFGNELHKTAAVARKPGASFVLEGQGHQPDAALVASVVETVTARLDAKPEPAPPSGLKVFPFS